MAGMVNHAMNNETAKITDTIYLAHDTACDGKRGGAEKRVISC